MSVIVIIRLIGGLIAAALTFFGIAKLRSFVASVRAGGEIATAKSNDDKAKAAATSSIKDAEIRIADEDMKAAKGLDDARRISPAEYFNKR